MKQRKFLIFCVGILLCSCNHNNGDDSGIILIDANRKYPELELKLSDIAEISYIPLKSDKIIFGYTSVSRALFVYEDKIILGDKISSDPKLLMYDRMGTHIRTFGSRGHGPGEYMSIYGFVVDTFHHEITLYDNEQTKLIVYGLDGKFKRQKFLNDIDHEQSRLSGIENINVNSLLLFNNASRMFVEQRGREYYSGKTMLIIDKQTLSALPFHSFEYTRPYYSDRPVIIPFLTTTKEGVYLTSARSDTIFFMNRNLEIVPKFKDVTDYREECKARIFPTFETDKYTFFVTVSEIHIYKTNSNYFPIAFFAYDKKKQQIFRLNTNNISENDREFHYFIQLIINDNQAILPHALTLNHDYAALLLPPEFLFKYHNQLPAELQEIAKNLKEDDNPVLMLIKFK